MARVALVTGGQRGIGLRSAKGCKRRAGPWLLPMPAMMRRRSRSPIAPVFPATNSMSPIYAQCAEAIAKIEAEVGVIEILVNNAGITRDATMRKLNRDMWDAVIDTNLGACYNLCKLVWEGMNTRKFGRIVNIGSINGQAGQYGQVNYAAAKSGIHGFTKALAQEGAKLGITVNAVAPGYVDTEMVRAVPPDVLEKIIARIPRGRLGKAEDIARGVVFLTADDADFVTGSTLSINGGQHMY
jgi:acetoacetyl-CoA reductase